VISPTTVGVVKTMKGSQITCKLRVQARNDRRKGLVPVPRVDDPAVTGTGTDI